jgi:hypothetical protein
MIEIRQGGDQGQELLPFAAGYDTKKNQFIQEVPRAHKTVSFTGSGLVSTSEEEENVERRYAILVGLFIPWDSIKESGLCHGTEQHVRESICDCISYA